LSLKVLPFCISMGKDQQIIALAQNQALLCLIGEKAPTIKWLLEKEPEGTCLMLSSHGAITAMYGEMKMEIRHTGDDAKKTWKDYLSKIQEWLDSRDSTRELAPARAAVAEYIHKQHYTVFPCWPAVGAEQESYIVVNKKLTYETEEKTIVMVAVEGDATVTDIHEKDSYFAKVKGSPLFKILYTQPDKLKQIEDAVKADPCKALDKMKQKKADALRLNTPLSIHDL